MCPACMAAAALTAAKVASVGGLAAYGVKKLVDKTTADRPKDGPEPHTLTPPLGDPHEEAPSRVP